ncbi:MAG: ABC transporter permease [Alphaproteobacteria bacterium]
MTAIAASTPAAGVRLRKVARRREAWFVLLALPAILLLAALFAWPLLRLFWLSVADGTFAPYQKALGDSLYLQIYYETFRIALIVTFACLVLGYPVAWFLANASRFWSTLGFVFVLLPFWTSILVRTYAWMVLLGRNGVLNRMLIDWGVIETPIRLLHNETGVLIGMVHVLLPYVVFPIYSAMVRIDRDLLVAAEGLGAPGWRIFWRIYLPLSMPGVFAGAALVFALSLGFFITPALLGGGRVVMIAVVIEQQVREFLDWPFAAALSALLLAATIAAYGLMNRFLVGRRDG